MTDEDSRDDLIIRIAGEGGEGIISAGDFITQACARAGLEVYTFKTFPAEVKGGYAMYQTRTSSRPIYNQGDTFNVLCALNGEAYTMNRAALRPAQPFQRDHRQRKPDHRQDRPDSQPGQQRRGLLVHQPFPSR